MRKSKGLYESLRRNESKGTVPLSSGAMAGYNTLQPARSTGPFQHWQMWGGARAYTLGPERW